MKTKVMMVSAAALLFCASNMSGQSWKNVGKVVNKISGYFSDFDITGTWAYEGADVVFESDNLLRKAGGRVISSQIEEKLNSQLLQLGLTPGKTAFYFDTDGTFRQYIGDYQARGSYVLDEDDGVITLNYLNHVPLKCAVSTSSSGISLLFRADAFLSMVTFIGGNTGIGIINSMTSVMKGYDGMMVGVRLIKE